MGEEQLNHHAELPWFSHQARIREMFDKQALDAERFSAEIARLIISNLFVLNAGGVGAIPTVAAFLADKDHPWTSKFEFFARPGLLFISGAIAALLAAFCAYLNYQSMASMARWSCQLEMCALNKVHPAFSSNQGYAETVENGFLQGQKGLAASEMKLRRFFWASIICGFASLGLFVGGCYFFTEIAQKNSHQAI
jgi:hypothetical protein